MLRWLSNAILIEPVKWSERRRAEPEDKCHFILIWKRKYVKSDFLLLKELFEAHPELKKESILSDIPLKRKCFLIELYLQYTRGTPFWYEKESLYIYCNHLKKYLILILISKFEEEKLGSRVHLKWSIF